MHVERCLMPQLLGGDCSDNPLAGAAGEPLENGILEDIGRQAGLDRDTTDPENTEIGSHQFELPQRHCIDCRTNGGINLATDQHKIDIRPPREFGGNGGRIRHHRYIETSRDRPGNGEVRRTGIDENDHARLEKRDNGAGQQSLAVRILGDPRLQRHRLAIGEQGAAINAHAFAAGRHLSQVAANRVFRNAKVLGEVLRQHTAALPQLFEDERLPLADEMITHADSCINRNKRA